MLTRFEQFCNAISIIQHSIQKIERAEMAKYGLKGPHAQCLLAISQYPDGITAAKLCDICEKDKAAISRAVAELEQADMLIRKDPDGKRYRSRLYLSARGREAADYVNQLVHNAVSQVSAGYDTQYREVFIHVLNLIAGNLQNLSRNSLEDGWMVS